MWEVKTHFRLSGNNMGQEYYSYKAPDGSVFSSLKKAREAGYEEKTQDGSTEQGGKARTENIDLAPAGPVVRLPQAQLEQNEFAIVSDGKYKLSVACADTFTRFLCVIASLIQMRL